MIVRVFDDGIPTDVPVTPETTCSDVIECCRDPGEETCDLVAVCPEHGGELSFIFGLRCVYPWGNFNSGFKLQYN